MNVPLPTFEGWGDSRAYPGCKWVRRGDHYDCLHNGHGRGQLYEDCCTACRLLVLVAADTMSRALTLHEQWCGHNADAPGDGIINRAHEAQAWLAPWVQYRGGKLLEVCA